MIDEIYTLMILYDCVLRLMTEQLVQTSLLSHDKADTGTELSGRSSLTKKVVYIADALRSNNQSPQYAQQSDAETGCDGSHFWDSAVRHIHWDI